MTRNEPKLRSLEFPARNFWVWGEIPANMGGRSFLWANQLLGLVLWLEEWKLEKKSVREVLFLVEVRAPGFEVRL
jgi:hypothetical protein